MKLVTGIEAIQSGKRFRYHSGLGRGSWISRDSNTEIMVKTIYDTSWEIEEEPREFWINLSSTSHWFAYSTQAVGDHSKNDKWIRVREIEK